LIFIIITAIIVYKQNFKFMPRILFIIISCLIVFFGSLLLYKINWLSI
jgi:hypothetical protein